MDYEGDPSEIEEEPGEEGGDFESDDDEDESDF
jgi:hypothetical protein